MKGETQLYQLQKMMQKHKRNPEYALVLTPFVLKRKSLKQLSLGEVILLPDESPKLHLMQKGTLCATVALQKDGKTVKLKIVSLDENASDVYENKKYEIVYAQLETLQIRIIEPGHKVELPSFTIAEVSILVKDRYLAKGNLGSVEGQLAITITEVYV